MAKIEITIDDDQIEAISEGRGLAALLRPVLNEILEAELAEHIGAEPHQRTDERTGNADEKFTGDNGVTALRRRPHRGSS